MAEEIIGMEDMAAVFAVTDGLGIHRESVRVELTKEDPGILDRKDDGTVEITLPSSESTEDFCRQLQANLEAMGYVPSDNVLGDEVDC